MPNMTGVELLSEIKNSRLTAHIPVVFLSSKSTMNEQIANYERGLEFFIAKPFNPKYLLSVVSRIIHNRDSMKQYFNSSLSSIEEFNGNFVHTDEKKFLISIAEIIKNNMENEQLGADFICHQMNITRILLYRRIKDLANTTPTEFIRNIRLKEAERLIKTTKLTIQEIMFQTGFNNKSYFYTIFKTEYGVSPNEYRKNN
jgi:AraC-like DNA-binding protein